MECFTAPYLLVILHILPADHTIELAALKMFQAAPANYSVNVVFGEVDFGKVLLNFHQSAYKCHEPAV